MKLSRLNTICSFFLATALSVPVLGANPGQPGMINYVEGQVSIGGQTLMMNAVGSAQLLAGQTLTTQNGKAEVLLTPGMVLRVAEHSSVTLISPALENVEVRVGSGRAMVEVADIHKENNVVFDANGTAVRLVKTGLYEFDANGRQVRVFDGQAIAQMGARQIKIKGDHELNLNDPVKAQRFDKDAYEHDSFYRWASLRSDYLAQANVDAARSYSRDGSLQVGTGWYWDPWYGAYTFIPGNGVFYNPFGWGYYSPWVSYGVPYAYYGRGFRDFGGRGFGHPFRNPAGRGFAGHAGAMHGGGGFHGHGGRR